jgi:2-polyprenyl-3-methyl-5-hydroxy-6-metoxy-1,4-benzoquinol methylase
MIWFKKVVLSRQNDSLSEDHGGRVMSKPEKFWDRLSRNYDKSDDISEVNEYKSIGYIKQYLRTSDVVLDFGCATGTIASALADHVTEMHGNDLSAKMIEIAIKRAMERSIENIHFSNLSIFDDGYKRDSFDMVLSFSVLHLLDDVEGILLRINELVRPGGYFVSLTPCLGERILPRTLLALGKKIGVLPFISRFKIEELEQIVTNGGFKIVKNEGIDDNPLEYFIIAKKQ